MNFNTIISYDLHDDKNYNDLEKYLESLGFKKILTTTWIGNAVYPYIEIRKKFSSILDSDDKFFIVESTGHYKDDYTFSPYGNIFTK